MQKPPVPEVAARHWSIEAKEQLDAPSYVIAHQRCCAAAVPANRQVASIERETNIARIGHVLQAELIKIAPL